MVTTEDRSLFLAEDLAGVLVAVVLASLATLLLEGCLVSALPDADGLLGRVNLSVTAAAVARTFDFTFEAIVGFDGRPVVVDDVCPAESTKFLVLPVDRRVDTEELRLGE